MSALLPFLALDQTYDQVLTWINQQLIQAGFRVVQTFDLQVARLAHPECQCPHHETNDCSCQMAVLLVYCRQDIPATLVLHGQDGRTWVSLATPTGQRSNQHLEMMIRRILTAHVPHALIPDEVDYEARSAV